MRFDFYGDVPTQFDPAWLKMWLLKLAESINYQGTDNFPNQLPGDTLIQAGSLSGSALKAHTLPWGALTPATFYVPLLLVEPAVSTQNLAASPANVGPWFHWDPSQWPPGTWTLEASIYANAGTTSLDLYGAAEVAGSVVTTTQANIQRVVSTALTMPNTVTDLYLRLWTSVGTATAYCKGARLVFTVT